MKLKTVKKNTKNVNTKTIKKKMQSKKLKKHIAGNYSLRFEKQHEKSNLYKKQKTNVDVETDLIKVIKSSFSPSSVTPKSDYYTYINYKWLSMMDKQESKTTKQYYSQIDDFRIIQDKVYKEITTIIKDYSKQNTKRAKELNNVYHSFLNLKEEPIKRHILGFTKIMDEQFSSSNLWEFLALINKNEVISWGCPIVWNVLPDDKHSKQLRNNITNPELSLYDYNLYYDDAGQTPEYIRDKKYIKKRYLEYITQIFDTTLPKDHGLNAEDVFQVEADIVEAINCINIKNDSVDFYNIVKTNDSLSLYGFDWIQFCKYLGYKKIPDFYICSSLNYLSCIIKILIKEWSSQKWKSYWYYIFLRQIIRFHKTWKHIHYDFNEYFLRGMQVPYPPEIIAIMGTSFTFNTLLSEEYIKSFKDNHLIQYAKNIGNDLLQVFKRRLERHKWFDKHTKDQAILKIKNIDLIIGYPKKMRYDPLLDYSYDDVWGNILKITQWKVQKYLNLEGREVIDIPYIDWKILKLVGSQPYIVNAFYTPSQNSIYIPLAYLQKPFIDLDERGIEYNLTRIGYTIAHEMSHALDDLGNKYNWNGTLNNWVSPNDLKKITLIEDDITKQYEEFAKRDGIIFDASIALGENMADISGLAICEEYLRDFQEKNSDIIPIKDLSFQAFFVYFASTQRQHIYKASIKSQLKVNPHPLDKYRTNIPLSRLELFRSIYNIKKGDDMYWPSTSTIW
jgi:putative endopeptidase